MSQQALADARPRRRQRVVQRLAAGGVTAVIDND
jgi:hypothetical protein